jgi:hypothetical protein
MLIAFKKPVPVEQLFGRDQNPPELYICAPLRGPIRELSRESPFLLFEQSLILCSYCSIPWHFMDDQSSQRTQGSFAFIS